MDKIVQNRLDQFRDDSKRKEEPQLKELTEHVVPRWAPSWKKLGVQLKIDEHLLQNIERDNINDCEGCCSKMLSEWLNTSVDASWETLLAALDKLTADHINNDEDAGDVADNEVHHESLLESKPLTKLKAKYIKVVNKIKKIIESKRFKVEDLIANMCLADDRYSVFSTDDEFSKITTINELFLHINKYCTIFEYKLLQMFLESLDECDEAVKLLDDFTEELQHSVLKELDLMSESKDQLKPKIPMHGTCTLKIKYTGDQKCTLSTKNMVQRIVCESLKLHKLSIIFLGLEEGCIAFVYQISAVVKSYILEKSITPNDLGLLALHDIKCLIVDDTEIPVPLEFKEQVDKIVANLSKEKQEATLRTLQRIYKNIIQHPNNVKYQQIKLTGKLFSSTVWQCPACRILMMMSGWVVEKNYVKLRDDSSVQIVLAIISLKLQGSTETSLPSTTSDVEFSRGEETDVLLKQLAIQLDKFFTVLNPEDCKEALLILQTYFKNIDLQPHDEKNRQIDLNDRMFYCKVWQYPVSREFMKMSGWEVEGASIKLKNDSCIQIVLQLLKEKLESSWILRVFQRVLTVKQFETLTSAILSKNIAEICHLLQCCSISSAGRVYCEDKSSMNLLLAAVTTHQSNIVKLLVRCYNVNPYEVDPLCNYQRPCIFQIFHQESEAFIIDFLSAMYTINVCAKNDGFTLLHTAVLANCLQVLSSLFSKNCKAPCLKPTDDKRRTSLHLAYLYGNTEMATFLLQHGADESATDIYGKTPFDYINGEPHLVAYSQHIQNTRKIHSNPFSIEYNFYIKLLGHGIDPEQATALTMKEFSWLLRERPIPPRSPNVDLNVILKDLAHFLVTRPTNA